MYKGTCTTLGPDQLLPTVSAYPWCILNQRASFDESEDHQQAKPQQNATQHHTAPDSPKSSIHSSHAHTTMQSA
jgi:hypothetical protein